MDHKLVSERLSEYLIISNEINLFKGLRESEARIQAEIESSIANVMTVELINKHYRHDKIKKFE